jgi:tetratricopeptide (TPR) repeat protein
MSIQYVKKGLMITAISFITLASNAQSIDEALKLYKYNRYESAKKILEPLAATNPMASYYVGLCELGLENLTAASAIFAKNPEDAASMSGAARILFLQNKPVEANALLQKVILKAKKKDASPFLHAANAITYTYGGNYQQAVDWYKKAQELGNSSDIYLGLSDALRKIQDGGGQSMRNLEYAEEMPESKSLANYKMGNLWYAAKNYEAATESYKKASELDPSNPLPFKDLANAYYKINKYDLAKQNIEKYLTLSDNAIDDQINYANILYLSKDYPGAIKKMQELISKGAEKPYMYRIIAFSQLETGDVAGALPNMDKFFAKQDKTKILPIDYTNYGKMLLKTPGKESTAAVNFQKGIDMDTTTDKSALYRELGGSYRDLKDYKTSLDWFKKVLSTNSATIDANDYWYAGAMSYYTKDYIGADMYYKTMTEKYPTEPSGFFWRGNVAAIQDSKYTTGAGLEYYKTWLTMIDETDATKKANLTRAYTYMAMVAYTKKDIATAKAACAKLQSFDPADDTAKQILNSYASPTKTTPTTPTSGGVKKK